MATKLSPVLVADYNTSLTTKISVGGTTATLLSNIDDDSNTMPDGLVYLTLDGDNSSKEHISATKTGANLTAIKSVSRQGVESAGVAREHRVGSTVILTNFAHIKFLNDLLDGTTDLDGSNPLKYDADPTLVNDADIATKKYIDDIAIAGCSKATDALEGISKLSVAAASATDPIALGENDGRVPTQDENNALVGTKNTPSTSKPYVNNDLINTHTANTAGYLTGGSSAQSAFASWAAVADGSFRITVDGTAYNVDAVDFSGDGDMDAVAATIQAALRTATSGTETVVWDTDHFVITSVQSDEDSEISVTTTSTGTVGTDISGLGANDWMDCDSGNGVATQGTSDHDSLVKLDAAGKIANNIIKRDDEYRGVKTLTAGETINGATLPVPCYQNTTDNEWYACDANDTAKLNFVGFAISNSTDGNAIDLQMSGIVKGFSGLDEGEKYYVQDAVGTIGKTPGTYTVLVGIAISSTELLILTDKEITNYQSIDFDAIGSNNQSQVVTCGFRPKMIIGVVDYQSSHSVGNTNIGKAQFQCALNPQYWTAFGYWNVGAGAAGHQIEAGVNLTFGSYFIYTITSITKTGFTFSIATTGDGGADFSHQRFIIIG